MGKTPYNKKNCAYKFNKRVYLRMIDKLTRLCYNVWCWSNFKRRKMQDLYLGIVIGALSPLALVIVIKAIKRTPRDLKSFASVLAGFIRS